MLEETQNRRKPQNTQNMQKEDFLFKEEGYAILGAVFAVYEEMRRGLNSNG
jgi:hypothetical protein